MDIQKEFSELVENLKTERDEIKLKLHLASMDAKEEFDTLDEKWDLVTQKAAEIADDAVEVSEEGIAKAKELGQELKETYQRLRAKISE
jgi:putative cell wall-binding protein